MRRIISLSVLLTASLVLSAQNVRTISGEGTYTATSHVTLDEAKQTVVQRARLQALADEFGTMMQTQTMTSVVASSEDSAMDMSSLSLSEVKGEWLGDIREPEITVVDFNLDGFTLKAVVAGRAREITSSKVDFVARVLRNGTTPSFESDTFNDGDDMYVYFRTPSGGYLAIYLLDPLEGQAYCLLPYRQDENGLFKVSNNREYVFFSPKDADNNMYRIVDEYSLTTDKPVSSNHIFVIFSPNEFSKAIDEANEDSLRQLGIDAFNKWLTRSRTRDTRIQVQEFTIQVRKK